VSYRPATESSTPFWGSFPTHARWVEDLGRDIYSIKTRKLSVLSGRKLFIVEL